VDALRRPRPLSHAGRTGEDPAGEGALDRDDWSPHRVGAVCPTAHAEARPAGRPDRRFIDGGMTAGIGDPDVLARTITVYTDVGAFQRALAIPGSDDVHALVVRRDGTILARGRGDPTDAQWDAIVAVLSVG